MGATEQQVRQFLRQHRSRGAVTEDEVRDRLRTYRSSLSEPEPEPTPRRAISPREPPPIGPAPLLEPQPFTDITDQYGRLGEARAETPEKPGFLRRIAESAGRAGTPGTRELPPPEPGPTPAGEFVKGVGRGVGQMVEAAGGTAGALSQVLGRPRVEDVPIAAETIEDPSLRPELRTETPEPKVARKLIEKGREIQAAPKLEPSEEAKETFNPRSLEWWAGGLGQLAPQVLSQLGLAATTGGGSAAVTAFTLPTLALEGGLAYSQATEKGAKPEEAAGIAAITGIGASLLERIPGSTILLNRFPGARQLFQRGLATRLAGRAAAGSLAESSTEAAQEAWADAVAYVSKTDPDAFANWQERYGGAGALGSVAGGGTAVGVPDEAPGPSIQDRIAEARREVAERAPEPAVEPARTTQDELVDVLAGALSSGDAERVQSAERDLAAIERNAGPDAIAEIRRLAGERLRAEAPEIAPEAREAVQPPPEPQGPEIAQPASTQPTEAAEKTETPSGLEPGVLPPEAPPGSVGMFPTREAGVDNIAVRFIDAKDASEARTVGALTNIREGRGSPLDAAKLFREQGMTPEDLAEIGVSLRGPLARDGLALANLHPSLFDRVVREEMPVARAAVIGRGDLSHEQQLALMQMLGQQKREPTNAQLEELIRFVRAAPEAETTQETLFGAKTMRQSLALEKAQLSAELKRQLSADRRLFGYLARGGRGERVQQAGAGEVDVGRAGAIATETGQLEEVYNRLSTMAGPVNDALSRGAEMVAEGRSVKDVANEIRADVTTAVEAELAALTGKPQPAEPTAAPRDRGEREGRPAGAEEAGVEPSFFASPQDLFGQETPEATRQEDLFGGPQRLTEAEANARIAVARLRPAIDAGTATEPQRQQYREALALIRRGEAQSEEEVRLRAAGEQPAAGGQQAFFEEPVIHEEPREGEDRAARNTRVEGEIKSSLAADGMAVDVDPQAVPHMARTEPPPDDLMAAPEAALDRIGDRLAGNLTSPEDQRRGKGIDAPKVVRAISKIAQAAGRPIPIRVGRVKRYSRQAGGLFFPQTMVIRINRANNIATAAHELGHGLERILFGGPDNPWTKARVGQAVEKELTKLGRTLYGSKKPAGGYKREGWAEYVRSWITQTDLSGTFTEPADLAPELTKWFEDAFSKEFPEVRQQFDAARRAARQWANQGAMERARQSMVDVASPLARTKRAAEAVRSALTIEKLVEMAQPFDKIARAAEQQRGKPLTPEEDPFFLISALRTTHAARTRQMVETGMIDLAGNRVGAALNDIRPLVDDQLDFAMYLWAKRTLALGPDRPSGLSLEDAAQIVQELDSPKFQKAAGIVYDWNNGVLDYAAQASPTFRNVVDRVRERDPGNYVPLQRVFEELDRAAANMPKGTATRSSPVKRLRGSGRRIKDIFQVMISQAEQTVKRGHERAVIDAVVKLSDVEGMGRWINEIPPDLVPAYTASFGRLLNELESALGAEGITVRLQDAEGADADASKMADLMGETVTFFTNAQRAPTGEIIYPVWQEGRVRWFEVDEQLFEALKAMDVFRLPAAAELVFGKPAAALRAGTTGLRASFGLIWNPLRDLQTLYVNTRSGANGGRLFAEWTRGISEMAIARTAGRRSEWVDWYLRLGLEMTQSLGQDIPHTRLAARRLFQGRTARTFDPRNAFEFYRDLVQTPEAAPRLAEFRLAAKEVGWEPGQPMTLNQSLQFMLAAKQVTTDFTAAGEYARIINRIVPFHNASIQGPRAHIRAAKQHPARFVGRGIQLSLATLALWWLYKDEEWYTQLETRERFSHWHFPFDNPFTGQKELLRIPRAFEVGQIFASLPEMLADAWYRSEPEQAIEWFENLWATSRPPLVEFESVGGLPLPVPETPVVQVVAEQLANRRFYFDTPIETMGEEKRPPKERFNEYTSRAAIMLGDLFDISPKRIDHAIQGFFGPVGGDILGALGLGAAGVDRDKEMADLPVVGRAFRRGGTASSRPKSVQEMYDLLEKAEQRQYSTQDPENPLERQRRLQLDDAARAVSSLLYIRQYVPDATKRARISQAVGKISAEAVQLHEADPREGLRRGQFASTRRGAEAIKKAIQDARKKKALAAGS